MDSLPDETLLYIFSYITDVSESFVLTRVCQRFRRIAVDRSLWRDAPLSLRETLLLATLHPAALHFLEYFNEENFFDVFMSAMEKLAWRPLEVALGEHLVKLEIACVEDNATVANVLRLCRGSAVEDIKLFSVSSEQVEKWTGSPGLLDFPSLRSFSLITTDGNRYVEGYKSSLAALGLLRSATKLETFRLNLHQAEIPLVFWLEDESYRLGAASLRVLELALDLHGNNANFKAFGLFKRAAFPSLEALRVAVPVYRRFQRDLGVVIPYYDNLTLFDQTPAQLRELSVPMELGLHLLESSARFPTLQFLEWDHDNRASKFPAISEKLRDFAPSLQVLRFANVPKEGATETMLFLARHLETRVTSVQEMIVDLDCGRHGHAQLSLACMAQACQGRVVAYCPVEVTDRENDDYLKKWYVRLYRAGAVPARDRRYRPLLDGYLDDVGQTEQCVPM